MDAMKLKDDLCWVGVLDKDLRVFDIIMHTEFGTTYNSYVLKCGDKTVLFETAKAKFFDEFYSRLTETCDVKSIDYIVVDHTEPDHAGSIERLLDLNPSVKIVGTAGALGFLKHIVNRDFYSITAKDNMTLPVGDKTLQFLVVPNLHWPDTMYTYIPELKTLITCDSFGSHYAHEGILRSTVTDTEGYLRATKYYFDNILGPFKQPYMAKALARVRELQPELICPGHGPVLDSHIGELLDIYEDWCRVENPNTRKTVVMPYVSAYGYTRELAGEIARGVRDSGDIDVRLYDMVESDQAEVLGQILAADGLLFGTPTILAEALKPIWDLLTSIYPPLCSGKFASAFGSYGWSGEGVPHVIERLKQLKMKVSEGFRVRFKPSETELLDAYDFGYGFGCTMQGKEPKKDTGKPKLVRCLVCGEIFPAGLESCPVCGVGPENFVPVEVDEVDYRKDTDELFVILGSGTAALNAATAIRERNAACGIVMVSEEAVLPYNRPMLTKNMFAGREENAFAIHPAEWYEAQRITLALQKTVAAIDPSAREITTADGIKFRYDKLIYALGAKNFIPPFQGADLHEVVSIRAIPDIQKVAALLEGAKRAVVIGGGVLGLEAAWELRKKQLEVTVLETAPRLMPRQLDVGAAQMLTDIAAKNGVAIETGVTIQEICGEGNVQGVRLADGRYIEADLVVVSTGVRPNVALAKDIGLEVNRAVVVNEHMETSLPGIYACGDCAEYAGANIAIWPVASEMGKVAGANASGDTLTYTPVSAGVTMNALNTSLYSLGDTGTQVDKSYRTAEFRDEARGSLQKYFFLNNRLCGAILIGDTSDMARVTEAVAQGKAYKDLF